MLVARLTSSPMFRATISDPPKAQVSEKYSAGFVTSKHMCNLVLLFYVPCRAHLHLMPFRAQWFTSSTPHIFESDNNHSSGRTKRVRKEQQLHHFSMEIDRCLIRMKLMVSSLDCASKNGAILR